MGKDFQQKDMSGALFKNKRKTEGSDYPDYQGSVTIKGVKYSLGSWIKKSKAGETYMSLAVKPWQEKTSRKPEPGNSADEFQDDSIPF